MAPERHLPRIGALGPPGDPQCRALAGALAALDPEAVVTLGFGPDAPGRLVLGEAALTLQGVDLGRLATVYVSGFQYMDPVVPAAMAGIDWSAWRADYVVEQQRFSTWYSLVAELERRGVEVLNPVAAHVRAFSRPAALARIAATGMDVPEVLCSNDEDAIDAFCARYPRVLWRPVTGRAAWQRFAGRQRRHLVTPDRPPVLLAAPVTGPLLQCWLLRGEPLLCLARQAPGCEGLETLERFWCVDPAEAAAAQLTPAQSALAAPWLLVTYVLHDGRPCAYDVDPDPLLEALPRPHRALLMRRLAHRLLGRADPLPAADAGIRERPLPFLRRMLQDLFVYEASKYPEP